MSAQEKTALIFLPGLSTAKKVSDISGRGVGMDVVKTNLDRLGGKVEIASEIGRAQLSSSSCRSRLRSFPRSFFRRRRAFCDSANQRRRTAAGPARGSQDPYRSGGRHGSIAAARPAHSAGALRQSAGVVPSYADQKTGQREVDRRLDMADRRSPWHSAIAERKQPRRKPICGRTSCWHAQPIGQTPECSRRAGDCRGHHRDPDLRTGGGGFSRNRGNCSQAAGLPSQTTAWSMPVQPSWATAPLP